MNWYEQWQRLSPHEKLERALKHLNEDEVLEAKEILIEIIEAKKLQQADVIKSVCRYCGNETSFRTDGKKVQCADCGRWWRQTVS